MSDPQYTRQAESELSPTIVGHDDSGHPEFSFLGVTYRRHADGLYYSGKVTGINRKALHNVVYRCKHGKISLGHAVAHADGDPANNAINNLVLGRNKDSRELYSVESPTGYTGATTGPSLRQSHPTKNFTTERSGGSPTERFQMVWSCTT